MPKIKVLPQNIANKIAAGEVVDRPAAVVKELVENAIDAEASEITVVISQAGKELIQVIDNGCGMSEEDALTALERHATSKISEVHDLDRILTLGFRGEALPSIASVSRVEIKTCPGNSQLGTLLLVDGGVLAKKEKAAAKAGTTVTVKNLFYNTPARRNFLRADTTEFNHILKTVKRFFLAYPDIHFTFINNGEEVYNFPAVSQDERLIQVFGQKLYDDLVYVREELNEISLEGYVCKPDKARGNTANQFVYLNRRTIINRNLAHAVFQGYGNLIERSRYPQFVIYLTIPPHLIDVNVHPTKMEVRFANERVIYHMFLSAVRKAIQKENIVPEFSLQTSDPERKEIIRHFQSHRRYRQPVAQKSFSFGSPPDTQTEMSFSQPSPEEFSGKPPVPVQQSEDTAREISQANLWQVHNRYIFSQIKSGLVIIDQHVAHERILYEKILKYLEEQKSMPSQQLLFSQTLELSLEDYLLYSDIKEWLEKIGFEINELSGRTIVIEAIPADVKVGHESKILIQILDYYRENEQGKYQPHEKIAAAFACKNAIKSGEKLSLEEMNALVDQLFATKEPYFCPHGRPVIITFGLEELDKKFKRI
ncbi:MAG: DNA mismatch repair endonuclease MutL [Calditrichia bacterium]